MLIFSMKLPRLYKRIPMGSPILLSAGGAVAVTEPGPTALGDTEKRTAQCVEGLGCAEMAMD